ncbi:MAG: DUF2934 domain-containing protein [Nitrospirota bacterium]
MKPQKAQESGERKLPTERLTQPDAPTPLSTPVHQARPSFDDLHAHIATRAYELYVQRGCSAGGDVDDWLEAEREIVSREFPVYSSLGKEDSL